MYVIFPIIHRNGVKPFSDFYYAIRDFSLIFLIIGNAMHSYGESQRGYGIPRQGLINTLALIPPLEENYMSRITWTKRRAFQSCFSETLQVKRFFLVSATKGFPFQ